MVKKLIALLNPQKVDNINSCYYCGNNETLDYNNLNGIYTCKNCKSIIENTKKELVAC